MHQGGIVVLRFLHFRPYTIEDIRNHKLPFSLNPAEMRQRYKIAFVDDRKNYDLVHSLVQRSFRLEHFRDVLSIDNLKPFDIVLCDYIGVGHHLSSDEQGLFIVKNVRLMFPWKYVISYTASDVDQA